MLSTGRRTLPVGMRLLKCEVARSHRRQLIWLAVVAVGLYATSVMLFGRPVETAAPSVSACDAQRWRKRRTDLLANSGGEFVSDMGQVMVTAII